MSRLLKFKLAFGYAALVALVALTLAGCGGGGGGEGGSTGGGGGSVTGLIPAAPTAGAVLHADASALLSLRPGAEWHYRGRQSDGVRFGVLVNHTGTASSATISRRSTANDDNDSISATSSAGLVSARETLQLSTTAPAEEISYPLLRSPVRQSDQLVQIDRTGVPTGVDFDGDRVLDTADVAAYSVVVGNETVDLPDLQRSVTALRVDATYMVRVKKSSDGQNLPVISFFESVWYLSGVGVVRRTASEPGPGTSRLETDERLVYWDGLGEGMGALPPRQVRAAPTDATLGVAWSAVRVGNRALVATALDRGSFADVNAGLALSALDTSGNLLASRSYPALRPGFRPQPLLPLGAGVALLIAELGGYADPFNTVNLRLRRFDTAAEPVGDAAGFLLPVINVLENRFAAAADGQKLWLLWVDFETASRSVRLWLRAFDSAGVPLAPAQMLASRTGMAVISATYNALQLGAAAGRLMATWTDQSDFAGGTTMSYAVQVGSGAPIVRSLGPIVTGGLAEFRPLLSDQRQVLAWRGALGFGGFSNNNDRLLRSVSVADDATLARAGAGPLDGEILRSIPGISTGALFDGTGLVDGARYVGVAMNRARMLPAVDLFDADYLELQSWQGAAALAGTVPTVEQRRLERVGFGNSASFGSLLMVLPFDDRVLALGYNAAGLTATPVFKR